MYRNTSMVGLKCQIKPTMMVLFMGTLKCVSHGYYSQAEQKMDIVVRQCTINPKMGIVLLMRVFTKICISSLSDVSHGYYSQAEQKDSQKENSPSHEGLYNDLHTITVTFFNRKTYFTIVNMCSHTENIFLAYKMSFYRFKCFQLQEYVF